MLREYEIKDADDMFSNWVTDPAVSKFWGWKPHKNIEETKSLLTGWIEEYSKIDNYHWVIVLKKISQAIGYIYLNDFDDEKASASVHFLLSRTYWNQGIMTEACKAILDFAFDQVGVSSIHTHHHVENPASGKVLQKVGLEYVETKYRQIPDCEQISGDYCYYRISKEAWNHTK